MKKRLTALLLLAAVLLTMAGCSAADAGRKLDAAEDRLEAKLDRAEEKLEHSLRNAGRSAGDGQLLTEEEALQIALDHLDLAADQVTGIRTEYETDDGIPQLDVRFRQGDWEYEFEIHGETGQILSFDKDHRYD